MQMRRLYCNREHIINDYLDFESICSQYSRGDYILHEPIICRVTLGYFEVLLTLSLQILQGN